MEEKKKKIQKLCKGLDAFTKIAFVLLVVASIFMLLLMIGSLVAKDYLIDFFNTHSANISGNFNVLLIDSKFIIASYFILIIIKLIVISAVLFRANGIFKDIKNDGLPFKNGYSSKIRDIAIAIVVYSLLPQLDITTRGLWNINIGINLGSFLFAVVFSLLSIIFEYGCLLQQESDETL